jgi:hypothetical protein
LVSISKAALKFFQKADNAQAQPTVLPQRSEGKTVGWSALLGEMKSRLNFVPTDMAEDLYETADHTFVGV